MAQIPYPIAIQETYRIVHSYLLTIFQKDSNQMDYLNTSSLTR